MRVCYIYMEKENEEERARACACMRVCVCERERERKRERISSRVLLSLLLYARRKHLRTTYSGNYQ